MKALIADDHELFRTGIRHLLTQVFDGAEIVEAETLDRARECLAGSEPPDLLIMDLHMPGVDSIDSIAALRDACDDDAKLVIMSASEARADVGNALASGIDGYIPKSLGYTEIAIALRKVMSGHVYVPACGGRSEVRAPIRARPAPAVSHMTERQQNVLEELVRGRSSKEIGRTLGIAEATVKVHLAAIYRLLGVKSRAEAIARMHALDGTPRYRS